MLVCLIVSTVASAAAFCTGVYCGEKQIVSVADLDLLYVYGKRKATAAVNCVRADSSTVRVNTTKINDNRN